MSRKGSTGQFQHKTNFISVLWTWKASSRFCQEERDHILGTKQNGWDIEQTGADWTRSICLSYEQKAPFGQLLVFQGVQ